MTYLMKNIVFKYILIFFTLPLLLIGWFFFFGTLSVKEDIYGQGVTYLRIGNYKDAIECFTQSINNKVYPSIDMAYTFRAQAYNALKQYQKALDDAKMGMQFNPHSKTLVIEISNALLGLNQPDQALLEINKSIDFYQKIMKIDNPALLNQRAKIYIQLGKQNAAIEDLNKAIALEPKNIIFHQSLAYLYQDLNDYPKAISEYTKMLEINPNHAPTYNCRAVLYTQLGEKELAEKDLKQFKKLNVQ